MDKPRTQCLNGDDATALIASGKYRDWMPTYERQADGSVVVLVNSDVAAADRCQGSGRHPGVLHAV